MLILVLAMVFGWSFSLGAGAIVLGLVIVAVLATGMGLLFGAVNVAFRDARRLCRDHRDGDARVGVAGDVSMADGR